MIDLAEARRLRIVVIGDTLIDTYTECHTPATMTKTACLTVRPGRSQSAVGGAGIVALHASATGASVQLITQLGEDALARTVWARLVDDAGIDLQAVAASRTHEKERFVLGAQTLLQLERWGPPIAPGMIPRLVGLLHAPADLVLMADYRGGFFTAASIGPLLAATAGRFRAADSQGGASWSQFARFSGMDLVTPNLRELRLVLHDADTPVESLAVQVRARLDAKVLVATIGALGAYMTNGQDGDWVPAFARQVLDPIGAGDALLVYTAVALRLGAGRLEALRWGSCAAALACEQLGNLPIPVASVQARWTEEAGGVHAAR